MKNLALVALVVLAATNVYTAFVFHGIAKTINGLRKVEATFDWKDYEDGEDDELFEEAKAEVVKVGKCSTSLLQRRFGIGYGRASRLVDMLEEQGVVGPADGSKPRKVSDKVIIAMKPA